MNALESLCAQVGPSCAERALARVSRHVLAQLVCLGSHTITGLLNTCGHQFQDWSADYRLYERDRITAEQLFAPVRRWLCENQKGPVVIAMDDTHLRKTGRKIYGAKYTRDPMSPPFHMNFIRAQRFLQTAMACTAGNGQARMIPVDWIHAPTPVKPSAKESPQTQEDFIRAARKARISLVGVQRLQYLRTWLDNNCAKERPLWAVVDGSFTNGTVLKALPENTTLVGRIRCDAKLYHLPEQNGLKGRHRSYGEKAPTPEQARQDDKIPWQQVCVFYGGVTRELRVKQLTPVRWRTAGEKQSLQLVVIAPTPYRLSKHSKLLYRKPAYLVCTNPNAAITEVVQHYLWRWDIEVNHRDEKTLLGVGEAQVRTPQAVQNVTGCAVAAYAMLLTAAAICQKQNNNCEHLPAPKWQRHKSHRPTTMKLIQNLRYELWARSIHFSAFMIRQSMNTKPHKIPFNPNSALLYTTRYS